MRTALPPTMRESFLSSRDRGRALLLVVLVHGLVLAALLTLGGSEPRGREDQQPLETFDIALPPTPPRPQVEARETRSRREEGAAAPPNIESRATPVVAPEPVVPLPVRATTIVAPTPNEGAEASQGAAPMPGPGSGAGGEGAGTGSGGSGGGPGGGGKAGTRPALVSRSLTQRDYPPELRRRWPEGGRVLVIFSVQLNGRATDCSVFRSSGDPEIDAATCRLVERRLRFRPARDENGVPFVERYGYAQAPVGPSSRGE